MLQSHVPQKRLTLCLKNELPLTLMGPTNYLSPDPEKAWGPD